MSRFRFACLGFTCLATAAALSIISSAVNAADKVTFLTSWYAQAEHGGFYQAKAAGIYEKAGLDVTIKMGGPQVNGLQLLLAGEADVMMGYDFQVLNSIAKGLPVITIATSFQKDLQGIMTHDDVKGLDDMKDKTILVATPGRTSWWPWMKRKFGYTDAQTQAYTFNLQPFFNDKNIVQQSYPSSEPFQAMQKGVPVKFFLMADYGYPPYGTTMVAQSKFAAERPDVARRFVRASIEGWKSYLKGDPSPANALIQADNPKMSAEQIAFGIKRLNELEVADGGDAKTMGMGIITEARWKATYDLMVQEGLLAADTDWKKGFTTEFVKDLKITSR
ncbi:nitrate/sulfonate/bicarbonate ABC transporter periplasmic protein [Rhodoplanes sp. Z2-YC6860]|nr:nitrate/sulfonate/bicarbonate ABC transporter periplasmic protein [Rhodoplanes sp. Z2-YC6860]